MTERTPLSVVVLAAGKGKRMGNPDLAKVLTPLDGTPLLAYVLRQAKELMPDSTIVIVGHQAAAVESFVAHTQPAAQTVFQAEQLGTGHAVMQTRLAAQEVGGDVLILSGDVPLVRAATLAMLLQHHRESSSDCTVLTTSLPDPTGYGRVIARADGTIDRIVEQKDATADEAAVNVINAGIYVVNTALLFAALERVRNDNAQAEYYLTDIVQILRADGRTVRHFHITDHTEVLGINTSAELAIAEQILHQRSHAS
jgi:UDP-N-acetylglucosamine diphosphorylase/glucosamine-1-phosphate N-acetyltransferase